MKTAIRQHDITDCAAACIASVARHYGEDIPISLIREASGTSQAGTSIKGILDAAQAIGFRATGYKSDDKALEAARLQDLADYAAKNNLPAKFAKDYGWDPVPLPAASRGAPAPVSAPPADPATP